MPRSSGEHYVPRLSDAVSTNGDPTEYQEMAKSGTHPKMIVADGHEF